MYIKASTNASDVGLWLNKSVLKQMHFANVQALNNTAKIVQKGILDVMRQRFDRPTPYTMNALRIRYAHKGQENPEAAVFFKDEAGKGTEASKFLSPNMKTGGRRNHKRFEKALIAKGLMPANKYVMPASGAQLDAYGNVKRGQITKVMSALKAFGQQGYDANRTNSKRSQRKVAGSNYFVGDPVGMGLGIWQRVRANSGTMGGGVVPVFMYVDAPRYRIIIPFDKIAENIAVKHLPIEYNKAFERAMATAR